MRILFQRSTDDARTDDIVRIKRVDNHLVNVAYTYRNGTTTEKEMTHAALEKYMSSLFQLVTADTHPFILVQFDFPLMPSICLHPHQVSWNSSYIIEQVRLQLSEERATEPESLGASLFEQFANANGVVFPH